MTSLAARDDVTGTRVDCGGPHAHVAGFGAVRPEQSQHITWEEDVAFLENCAHMAESLLGRPVRSLASLVVNGA